MASLSEAAASAERFLHSPLAAVHRRLGARMVEFAGWQMPVQYRTGILAEHHAVRGGLGLFDLSHMARLFLRGSDALALAQQCCTRDLGGLASGMAAYSVICQPDGGIVDDVVVYRLGQNDLLLIGNAANRHVDLDLLVAERDRLGLAVAIEDRTIATALLGVQGPSAQTALQPLCNVDLGPLPGYSLATGVTLGGVQALAARTGYTGEDGFEVLVDAGDAERLWTTVQEQGAVPAGLGARDTLRTEAGFALYGQEVDRTTNPYEARLGWVVDLHKTAFVGRESLARLKQQGVRRKLVGLQVAAGGVPRHGAPLLDGDRRVGQVTSGTFSPTLRRNIAMGYVPTERAEPGQRLSVEVRGTAAGAEVARLPFVAHRSRARARM